MSFAQSSYSVAEGLDLAQDGPHAVIDLGEHGGGTLTLQYLDAGGLAGEDVIFAA